MESCTTLSIGKKADTVLQIRKQPFSSLHYNVSTHRKRQQI